MSIEDLVKLNKKLTTFKMTNGFYSIGTSNQVGQNKMTYLIKIDNGVLVKWDILCFLMSQNNY
jgi:hypothetical protein